MKNIVVPPSLIKKLPRKTAKFIVFVFTHLISSYSYAEEIEDKLYFMDDPRLEDYDNLPDQKTYTDLFFKYLGEALEKARPIIELPYNPYTGFLLSIFKKTVERNKASNILAVSFFHPDSEVQGRADEYSKFALDMKFETINSMIAYPYIKKIEIPIDEVITGDFLKNQMM
jgi:hypothetical protein